MRDLLDEFSDVVIFYVFLVIDVGVWFVFLFVIWIYFLYLFKIIM